MATAWSMLQNPQPTTLTAARALAHRGAQWPSRAARANLDPVADDSHSALTWHPAKSAFLCEPLKGGIQVGLRVAVHELVFKQGQHIEAFSLVTNTDAEVAAWLDANLAAAKLKPVTGVKLPYEMPSLSFARAIDEGPRLAALAGWFAAGAEVLDELRHKYKRYQPGPSRCWPHHFDLAMVVDLEPEKTKDARAIGIGLSPGDDYYAQPYFYLSPYPKPDTANLPELPPGGRWHTREFFGAVATAVDLLALEDPRGALYQVLEAAFAESLKRLGAG
jgi:hypothetical protein